MTDITNDENYEPSPWEPVAEQVERYLATDGAEGYEWMGGHCIILTTTGRRTGKLRRTPLMKVKHGDGYIVIASLGGAPQHPQWYLNITEHPDVRRMLLAQKSISEGAIALVSLCARYADLSQHHEDEAERERAHLLLDLLTPIAKSGYTRIGIRSSRVSVRRSRSVSVSSFGRSVSW